MTVKDRIKFFCKNANITISEFEKTLNVANGYVNSISKSVGIDKINIILENFPNINLEWLLTGKGEMLKTDKPTDNQSTKEQITYKTLPLIPIDAIAGVPAGDFQGVRFIELMNLFIDFGGRDMPKNSEIIESLSC